MQGPDLYKSKMVQKSWLSPAILILIQTQTLVVSVASGICPNLCACSVYEPPPLFELWAHLPLFGTKEG